MDKKITKFKIGISLLVPCRDEERFIGRCLDSLISINYPKEWLEVLVIDGESNDGTRKIVETYAKRYPYIKLLGNPKKSIPSALNIGIRHAKGDFVVRMDAHATYEEEYLVLCLKYLFEYSADRVGGRIITVPRDPTLMGHAIALALSLPFGVGNAPFRTVTERSSPPPLWVDTVPFWCCRRELFNKVGLYNEDLARSEDIEYSLRLKRKGYKTLLVPSIVSKYYARSNFKSFWRHNLLNGIWAVLPSKYTKEMSVSPRHLVPLAFVGSVIGSGLLSLMMNFFFLPFLIIVGLYSLVNICASMVIAIREGNLKIFFVMLMIFGALHISYGLGSVIGLVMVVTPKWVRRTG